MLDPDRDDDFLAADYALGTLDGAERRRAERRMRSDTSFAQEVASWQQHLMPMIEAVEPIPAPPPVWNAVLSELPRPPARPVAAPPSVLERGVAAAWKWLAIGSMGVAAASLAALLVAVNPSQTAGLTFTASIAGADGMPLYAAWVDPESDTATLMPLVVSGDGSHAHELWLIPEGGTPLSLGLLDPAAPLRIRMAPEMMDEGMATGALAVSLEPAGGSPTGQPTGPVVGQGLLHSI